MNDVRASRDAARQRDYLARLGARELVGAQAAKVAASAIGVEAKPQHRRHVAHHLMSS
jgi:hypothetical protein